MILRNVLSQFFIVKNSHQKLIISKMAQSISEWEYFHNTTIVQIHPYRFMLITLKIEQVVKTLAIVSPALRG